MPYIACNKQAIMIIEGIILSFDLGNNLKNKNKNKNVMDWKVTDIPYNVFRNPRNKR
jgi:hypothetical protein